MPAALQEEYVLEHMAEVFSCLRSCNVALRWLLLHTAASHRKLRAAVASAAPPPDALLALLLDTALLEYEVRQPCAGRKCPGGTPPEKQARKFLEQGTPAA